MTSPGDICYAPKVFERGFFELGNHYRGRTVVAITHRLPEFYQKS